MIKFRTEIEESSYPFSFGLDTKALTIGSCFSDLLYTYLEGNKIEVLHNPFGNLFNPISIFKVLSNSLNQVEVNQKRIVESDGIFSHFDLHSDIRAHSKDELIEQIQAINSKTNQFISNCSIVIITMGTAWIHELKADNQIVSNCHKKDSSNFKKRILEVAEITNSFDDFYEDFRKQNSKAKILVNVSPIRHTREGLINNNLSKSILKLAAHSIITKHKDAFYFPGYELLIDDLRDYRFYAEDLIHPNSQAQKYVIQYFEKYLSSSEFISHKTEWSNLKSMFNHRPYNPNTQSHLKFLQKMLEKFENYQHPVDLSAEIKEINKRLKEISIVQN